MTRKSTGNKKVDTITGEVYEEVVLGDVDTTVPEEVAQEFGDPDLEVEEERRLPALPDSSMLVHFEALHINVDDSFDDIKKKEAMFASYFEVPSATLKDFTGTTITVIGCAIHPGYVFKSRETQQYVQGDPFVLIKLAETVDDRRSGANRHVILRTTARSVMSMAQNLWLPFIGWFDWPGECTYAVHLIGQSIHLQEISHVRTTTR